MDVISNSIVATGPIPPIIARSADFHGKPMAAVASRLEMRPGNPPMLDQPLHRLYDVRDGEGLSRQQVARRLGISVQEVERQEQSSSDMLVSELRRWQKALDVPMAELLDEPTGELSPPVRLRARLLRVMKTVRSIEGRAHQAPMRRLVETLVAQLVDVMPELAEAAAWPAVGDRRRRRELGEAYFRGLALGPVDELDDPRG